METTIQDMLNLAMFTDAPPPGYKRRVGPMFQLGDYPDKHFSLDEGEADRAIAAFKPVPADMEHMPTILDKKMGVLRRVFRKDDWIHGEADVPEWLDDALKDTASGVSLAFDMDKKDIKGWAWTLEPRITGAALMSKYAEFTARLNGKVGATKEADPTIKASDGGDKKKAEMSLGRNRMGKSLLDSLKARFTAAKPPDLGEGTVTADPGAGIAQTINFSAPGTADEDDEEGQSQAVVDFKADQIIARATEAVDRAIADGHLFTAGRDAALAAFTAAGYDNEQQGPSVVTFSRADGSVVADRMALLAEVLKNTPQHTLFASKLPVYILNGDRSPEEKESAAEQGKKQAAAFNAQNGVEVPDPSTAQMSVVAKQNGK